MHRRDVLKGGLVLLATATAASIYSPAFSKVFTGGSPWKSPLPPLPTPVDGSKLVFFSQPEADLVKAIFDRLIPADDVTMSASEAGCVTFVDHQLAGPYGEAATRYKLGPIKDGTPEQGNQSPLTPADYYRKGLSELDAHCRTAKGRPFAELTADEQDAYLEDLEAGKITLATINGQLLFAQLLGNVKEGFLADPIYGGNKDMVGWKMIGFPGSRYDFRDYLDRIGQPLDIQPVSLIGRV
jgi:gluconate 2-dehydrogenase gamma chain